jgi:putative MATE family efflux protein
MATSNASSQGASLLEGDLQVQLIRLSVPMLIALLVMTTQGVVDSLFFGRLGVDALNMIAFAAPLCWLSTSVLVGYGVGLTSAVARCIGAERSSEASALASVGILIGLAGCVAMGAAGLVWGPALYARLGVPPAVLPLLETYMNCWWYGMPAVALTVVGTAVLRGTGETQTSGAIFLLAALLHLLLDPIFIFGLGPIPALGVFGGSLGTVLGWVVAAAVALYFIHGRLPVLRGLPTRIGVREFMRTAAPVSVPAMVTYLLPPLGGTIMAVIMGHFGASEVTGFGVSTRIYGLTEALPIAVSAGLAPLVGQNFAAGRHDRVADAVRLAKLNVIGWGIGAGLLVAVIAGRASALFTDDPGVAERLALAVRIQMLGLASGGVIIIGSAFFNAVGSGTSATVLALLRNLVAPIPLALVAGRLWGFEGAVAGMSLGWILVHGVTSVWLRLAFRQATARPLPVQEPA